ncbi:MAG: RNA polymerase sigma factor [Acidobacteriaceae bacterium]
MKATLDSQRNQNSRASKPLNEFEAEGDDSSVDCDPYHIKALRPHLRLQQAHSSARPPSKETVSPVYSDKTYHLQDMHESGLIGAAREGHEWAFSELYRRNSLRLFKVIYAITRNREDAEDALQDSFLRAFSRLNQFDGRSSFSTWFTRIGINSAIMLLRKKRRCHADSMDSSQDESETWNSLAFADSSLDPEQVAAAREGARHLKNAVRRLPHRLRNVVEVQMQGDLSMQELADEVGATIYSVKSYLHRARSALRKSLGAAGKEPHSLPTSMQQGDA